MLIFIFSKNQIKCMPKTSVVKDWFKLFKKFEPSSMWTALGPLFRYLVHQFALNLVKIGKKKVKNLHTQLLGCTCRFDGSGVRLHFD